MNAYRTHAVVQNDGRVILDHVPLKAGQQVEVLVLAPAVGDVHATKPTRLQEALLKAPTLSEDELRRIEEVRQWLTNWPVES